MIAWQEFLEETKQMDWMEALFQTAAMSPPSKGAEGSALIFIFDFCFALARSTKLEHITNLLHI